MQDLSSGEMKDISAFLGDIPKITPKPNQSYMDALRELKGMEEKLQAAKDAAQPNRDAQGPVFAVGEVLDIRGGKFQVTKIEPGHLRLRSLPSYHGTPQ